MNTMAQPHLEDNKGPLLPTTTGTWHTMIPVAAPMHFSVHAPPPEGSLQWDSLTHALANATPTSVFTPLLSFGWVGLGLLLTHHEA